MNRQSGKFPKNHFIGLAANSAGVIVFGSTPGNVIARRHDQERIVAETDRYRKRFSPFEIFLPHDAPLFAGRDVEREGVAIVDHDTIAAQIHPSFIDISTDHNVSGTEITAAIFFVPLRRRQREKIDIVPFDYIFENRTAGNHRRGDQPRIV